MNIVESFSEVYKADRWPLLVLQALLDDGLQDNDLLYIQLATSDANLLPTELLVRHSL